MPFKMVLVDNPDEQESTTGEQFVAIVTCPVCGRRWKSTGALKPDDASAAEKLGARNVEMLAMLRNGCPSCSRGGGYSARQHGRLRGAWPGSRR
jgi:hypothetical protein